MSVLPLSDELLMLGFDDAAGKPLVVGSVLDLGLAGAVLVELVLGGRVTVNGGHLVITDGGPVDDPVAEAVLARLRSAAEPRELRQWVPELAVGLRDQILERLVATGVVERAEIRVFGLFSWVRYPLLNPAPETAAQFRLDAAIRHGSAPSRHTAALASLLHAIDLGPHLYPDLLPALVRSSLDDIATGDWAPPTPKAGVGAICAAVREAVSASCNPAIAGSLA